MYRNQRRRIEGVAVNEMPADPAQARRKKAIAIAAKIKRKYPYAQFGRSYTRRGSPETLEIFGPTFREANPAQKAMRKRYGYTGRGLYTAKGLRDDYETLMGKRVSRAISRKASNFISNFPLPFSGSGLYTNNLIANGTGSIPTISGSSDETGSVTISHTEYIADIFGPGVPGGSAVSFLNEAYPINPGMEKTFPWLSQIAQNYEEYEFKQLIFSYSSTITDIGSSTNGQCGTLTMATDYNAAHKPFSDKQEMLSYAHSYSSKTTESMDHGVECDPSKNALSKQLYVRTQGIVDEDIKTYDHGLFQIAISNIPSSLQGQSIGELRVSYTVTLRKPKLYAARGLGIQRDFYVTSAQLATAPVGNVLINTSLPVYSGTNNNLGTKLLSEAQGGYNGFSVVFPDYYTGALMITLTVEALETVAGNGLVIYAPILIGNVQFLLDAYGTGSTPTGYVISPREDPLDPAGVAGTDVICVAYIFVRASTNGIDNKIFFNGHPGMTSKVKSHINIMEYNSYDKDPGQMNQLLTPQGTVIAGNAI